MIVDIERYFTSEQKKDANLLIDLSNAIKKHLSNERKKANEIIESNQKTRNQKILALREFVQKRVNAREQKIIFENVEYVYKEVENLAEKLYKDSTFLENDSGVVINNLYFFENTLLFNDLLIAFCTYCLSYDETDLWHLSILICRYVYYALSYDKNISNFSFEKGEIKNELNKLSKYICEFWSEYLEESSVEPTNLTDDNKVSSVEIIDYEAGYTFAKDDAKNYVEKKQLEAERAMFLVSQCSKSLYILKSTMDILYQGEVCPIRKDLRRTVNNICDRIYDDSKDLYGELEDNKMANYTSFNLFQEELDNRWLNESIKSLTEILKEKSPLEVLSMRLEKLKTIAIMRDDDIIETFVGVFSDILKQSIPPDNLDVFYERIKKEFGAKHSLLPRECVKTLVSAEYLYDMFVKKPAPKDFDYSGIAVLYFQAFETAYNHLLIEPYAIWLAEQEVDKIFKERQRIKRIKRNDRTQEEKEKLSKNDKEMRRYFAPRFDMECFFVGDKFTTSLEIGKFSYFMKLKKIKEMKDDEDGAKLILFLERKCFKKRIDFSLLDSFSDAVLKASTPRNRAAHGKESIAIEEMKEDKVMVYDETNISEILNYKNLLYAFLDFFA